MTQEETPRSVEGVELPPVGTWAFDKAHTRIEFVARHMISKVRGRFTSFEGKVVIGERQEDSSVEVDIDAASIQTDQQMRDDHLRSPDFLDVERFPKLTFRSRSVRPKGGRRFDLVGDLTIRDVTREVVLDAEFLGWGPGMSPEAPPLAAFSAMTEIEREDWEVNWNVVVETGGFLVGKRAQIEIEAELNLLP